MCVAFEEYKDVIEMVLFDFTEYNVMWVESKLSGAAGVLGKEANDLSHWLICFRCAAEELRVIVAKLSN